MKNDNLETLINKAVTHGYIRHMSGLPLEGDSYTKSIINEIASRVASSFVKGYEQATSENIVIDWKECDGINVALIKRPNNKCQPYVVAWNYYHVDGTWGQGHYFSNIVDAVKFYDEEY